VDFAELMRNPGIEQDSFRGRSFAGIYMRHHADIAITFDRCFSCHSL
jgi:hypothetical protein